MVLGELTSRPVGADTYLLAVWLLLRLLGLVYLVALVSLAVQIKGLIGSRGIQPACDALVERKSPGWRRFLQAPTLCWWGASDRPFSDRFLSGLCWTGAALSLLLIAGVAPVPVLIMLWLIYLSLVHVGGVFLSFQWDALLLEMGFLAIFLAPLEIVPSFPPATAPSPVAYWLMLWLLFRLMFSSGVVKLRSRDPAWWDLTALTYHYETQPLPNRASWYAHQSPMWFHRFSSAVMFLIELPVAFLVFAPPPACYVAGGLTIALMLLIAATGNYCFFNLQTIALAVLVFDDALLIGAAESVFPAWEGPASVTPAPLWWNILAGAAGLLLVILSIDCLARLIRRSGIGWPAPIARLFARFRPFCLVNSYGLFAVMTKRRPEIVVEGSHDGTTWQEYEFRWKPGDLGRPPRQVAPHQPRLDWQMWFAALGSYQTNPWFVRLLARLLEGSPDVLALLARNPFPEEPPRYVRALLYDYRFTSFRERQETGHWWRRELLGVYCPPVSLTRADEPTDSWSFGTGVFTTDQY